VIVDRLPVVTEKQPGIPRIAYEGQKPRNSSHFLHFGASGRYPSFAGWHPAIVKSRSAVAGWHPVGSDLNPAVAG
jgi:hypothetical protein